MLVIKEGNVPSFEHLKKLGPRKSVFSFHGLTYLKMSISIKSRIKTHKLPFFGLIDRQSLHNPTKSGSKLTGVRNMAQCVFHVPRIEFENYA